MLDERGVKWTDGGTVVTRDYTVFKTWWKGNLFYEEVYEDGCSHFGDDVYTLLESRAIEGATPEQAVTATLRPDRCETCGHFTANDEFWIGMHDPRFPVIGVTSDSCDFWAGTKCKVARDGFCSNWIPKEKQ